MRRAEVQAGQLWDILQALLTDVQFVGLLKDTDMARVPCLISRMAMGEREANPAEASNMTIAMASPVSQVESNGILLNDPGTDDLKNLPARTTKGLSQMCESPRFGHADHG